LIPTHLSRVAQEAAQQAAAAAAQLSAEAALAEGRMSRMSIDGAIHNSTSRSLHSMLGLWRLVLPSCEPPIATRAVVGKLFCGTAGALPVLCSFGKA
jgi:hypothetical protein